MLQIYILFFIPPNYFAKIFHYFYTNILNTCYIVDLLHFKLIDKFYIRITIFFLHRYKNMKQAL